MSLTKRSTQNISRWFAGKRLLIAAILAGLCVLALDGVLKGISLDHLQPEAQEQVPNRLQKREISPAPASRGEATEGPSPAVARHADGDRREGAIVLSSGEDRSTKLRAPESELPALSPQRAESSIAPPPSGAPAGEEEEAEIPMHWGRGGNDLNSYRLDSDRTIVWSGSASARLAVIEGADPVGFSTILQAMAADGFRGKRLEFSGFVRTEGALASGGLWFVAVDAHGFAVAFDNMGTRRISGNTAWGQHSIVLDIPATAQSISYGAILVWRGSLWLDEVRIHAVDSSVATTAPPVRLRPPLAHRPVDATRLRPAPANLDFEETIVLDEQGSD